MLQTDTQPRRVWSGDPCPVPLARIPKNVALTAVYAYSLLASPNVRAVRVMRNAWGVHCLPLSQLPFHIIPSVPAMEYPHTPPANAILAGPIVVPTPPLTSADDHDLSAFLARGRTALFNMGSLFVFTLADVAAAADAFIEARRRLLPRGGLQVLWKIPHATSFAALLNDKLLGEDRESVRIEEWIGPPALAVLRHPNVVVSIHHGGASACFLLRVMKSFEAHVDTRGRLRARGSIVSGLHHPLVARACAMPS